MPFPSDTATRSPFLTPCFHRPWASTVDKVSKASYVRRWFWWREITLSILSALNQPAYEGEQTQSYPHVSAPYRQDGFLQSGVAVGAVGTCESRHSVSCVNLLYTPLWDQSRHSASTGSGSRREMAAFEKNGGMCVSGTLLSLYNYGRVIDKAGVGYICRALDKAPLMPEFHGSSKVTVTALRGSKRATPTLLLLEFGT